MLQQTQVDRVVPLFVRFLERFPDVVSCAQAPSEEVLAAWAGLGYYRRAVRLQAAAVEVVGLGAPQVWPTTAAQWSRVVGVGAYTAAAIASIAFGEEVAAVDTNVARVVSRWVGLSGPNNSRNRSQVGAAAIRLVAGARPGDINQALMELGASLCGPRVATCEPCPLRSSCKGSADPLSFGLERAKLARRSVVWAVAAVKRGGGVLARRRPDDDDLLGGTWELPWVEVDGGISPRAALAQKYSGAWQVGRELGTRRHAIASRSILLRVFEVEVDPRPEGFREQTTLFLRHAATSNAFRKCLDLVEASGSAGLAGCAAGEHVPTDDLVVGFPEAFGDQQGEDG
jgi:A/G-specific adenine glycosylase